MGGFGSGLRHDPLRARPLVESCALAIDVLAFSRAGAFASDSFGELAFGASSAAYRFASTPHPLLDIAFAVDDGISIKRVRQSISLLTTRPPFGGRQWWFRCPSCGRKFIKLFLPRGGCQLLCRRCHGMMYRSTQTHDPRVDRLRCDPQRVFGILRGEIAASETERSLAMKAVAM
jgi:hypothetical protein